MTSEEIHSLRVILRKARARAYATEDLMEQIGRLETINDIFNDLVKLTEGRFCFEHEEKDDEG